MSQPNHHLSSHTLSTPLLFHSSVLLNRGSRLLLVITPTLKSIPFSFYSNLNTTYSIIIKNNEQRISFTPFQYIFNNHIDTNKYIIDIPIELFLPLVPSYLNTITIDIQDTNTNLLNSYQFLVKNEVDDFLEKYYYFLIHKNYLVIPSVRVGFACCVVTLLDGFISFKVFKRLMYFISSLIRREVEDFLWLSIVKLLIEIKKTRNYDCNDKVLELCDSIPQEQSTILQSLIKINSDEAVSKMWENILDSCKIVRYYKSLQKKLESEMDEKSKIEIENCTQGLTENEIQSFLYCELSYLMIEVRNVSFSSDPILAILYL
ncbi:hypothetical protein ABK040_011821 [Willaertia magna]